MHQKDSIKTELLCICHTDGDEAREGHAQHCHSEYEIYYCLEGDVKIQSEGMEYKPTPDSILLFAPGVFHGVTPNPGRYNRVTIHFLSQLLTPREKEILLPMFSAKTTSYPLTEHYGIRNYVQAVLDCMALRPPVQQMALHARIRSLLIQIHLMQEKGSVQMAVGDRQTQEIVSYINQNLHRPLRLEDLAGRFYISKNQLTAIFRKTMGTTVTSYIRMKRLALAQREIQQGIPATVAAVNAGFGDYSNFYRCHRQIYGKSPVRERKLPCQPRQRGREASDESKTPRQP